MPRLSFLSTFLSTAPLPTRTSLASPRLPDPSSPETPLKPSTPPSSPPPPPPSPVLSASQQKIYFLKSLLLLIIVTAGGLSGGLSYYFIRNYQSKFYHEQFDNMIEDSILSIRESLHIKLQVNIQLSVALGLACPTLADWPRCTIPYQEYFERTSPLITISQVDSLLFLPIVKPEERSSFESYALNYFQNDGNYPSDTGITSEGPGIYSLTPDLNEVLSSNHTNSSDYDILVPILQLTSVQNLSSLIFYNAYSDQSIGRAIDDVLNCVYETSKDSTPPFYLHNRCGVMTDYIPTFESKSSAIGVPIFPSQNKTHVVGFTGALFSWASVLSSTSRSTSTFFCKIESNTSPVDLYFDVNRGVVKEKHELPKFTKQRLSSVEQQRQRTFVINEGLFIGETIYTITYYSTDDTPAHYLALIACLCCIGVAIFISVSFEIVNALTKQEVVAANRLLDSKRIFVKFLSHEIRTPLNTINLGVRVIQENLEALKQLNSKNDDSDVVNALINECMDLTDNVDENSNVAVATLNDLLNYDKIESKTFAIDKKPVDIWSVVDTTVHLLTLQAKEKNIKLRLKTQLLNPTSFNSLPDPGAINLKNLRVTGDIIKLGQVVRNLVSNALKFSPSNSQVGVTVHFDPQYVPATPTRRPIISFNHSLFDSTSVASEPDPEIVGYITISVTDTGPGLSPEQQEKLFGEGVQFNPNELQAGQGSGLGLWITREIVFLHHGTILAKSEGLGHGATFLVTLPVYQELQVVVDSPTPPPVTPRVPNGEVRTAEVGQRSSSLVSSFDSREHHIIVVDDAPSNRKLVSRLLRKKGFICHEAENGSECVQMVMAADYYYEFIVMDYEMPVMDGPSASRRLRDHKYDIIIIGVTGNALPEEIDHFKKQGANAVLVKPLNIDQLLEEVQLASRPHV